MTTLLTEQSRRGVAGGDFGRQFSANHRELRGDDLLATDVADCVHVRLALGLVPHERGLVVHHSVHSLLLAQQVRDDRDGRLRCRHLPHDLGLLQVLHLCEEKRFRFFRVIHDGRSLEVKYYVLCFFVAFLQIWYRRQTHEW